MRDTQLEPDGPTPGPRSRQLAAIEAQREREQHPIIDGPIVRTERLTRTPAPPPPAAPTPPPQTPQGLYAFFGYNSDGSPTTSSLATERLLVVDAEGNEYTIKLDGQGHLEICVTEKSYGTRLCVLPNVSNVVQLRCLPDR